MANWTNNIERIDNCRIRIPKTACEGMRVPGMIYAGPKIYEELLDDDAPKQVMNVAMLPGIVDYSIAMPDIHYGYGFPIGGVAAMAEGDGVISPGGVGFDINCGVRLIGSDIDAADVRAKSDALAAQLFRDIPCGVGAGGDIRLDDKKMEQVLRKGARWAAKNGYGWAEDIENCEECGALETDDTDGVSRRARERGSDQLGTLGAGNHFVEVQEIVEIYDDDAARVMGLRKGAAAVMIHSGSRGLGHQVCEDFIKVMRSARQKYGISLPDSQLSCAPLGSPEGRAYYNSMCAAANFAWANRHCLTHFARGAFERVFGKPAERLGLRLVYDVSHNIAKFERHTDSSGRERTVCVHRKGATRAFPAGREELPERYKNIGQPVLVPGDMGRASYVMLGTELTLKETFGSICHGAGRRMSRSAAKSGLSADRVLGDLAARGVKIQAKSKKAILEEAPDAYKNVEFVVSTCVNAGLAKSVAKLKPLIVIKG